MTKKIFALLFLTSCFISFAACSDSSSSTSSTSDDICTTDPGAPECTEPSDDEEAL